MNRDTQLAVIGGGPGGYAAAIRASQLGFKATLVEREHLGGVCLNWGCIPSKALIHAADVLESLKNATDLGIGIGEIVLDFGRTHARSRQIVTKQARGLQFLMRKNGIDVVEGRAALRDAHTIRVEGADGSASDLTADHILLATGGRPRELPGLPFDGKTVLSSRHALDLSELPDRAVIVGGGAIGVEFAWLWHSFGVAVTVVEFENQLLPQEDADVAAELTKRFRGRGIKVLTGYAADGWDAGTGELSVRDRNNGDATRLPTDLVLVAVGIRANTENLNLVEQGIILDTQGFVQVDEQLRTSVPHIYAAGDCTGRLPLAHVAIAQGVAAAETMAGQEPEPLTEERYRFMPRCTYASPQVASLGWTEAQLKAEGIPYNAGMSSLFPNGRARAVGAGNGFVKILAGDPYGEILGVHMVGSEVTELLPSLTLAHMMELTPVEIAQTVHAHPTLSEVVMEAAAAVEGQPLHA